MKPSSLLPLGALVLFLPSPVLALDCVKASSAVDKLICATPELNKADEEMGTTYFKLLRETTDPEFHEALIQSQRRWLKVRSIGPDRFGLAEDDKTDDRVVMIKMTRDRLTALQTAKPIRVMEQERKIISKDSGGTFAGFQTFCVLQPPPYGNWTYVCWGDAHRQQDDRICSSVMEWASGHMNEYRLVSVPSSGKPKPVAVCSTRGDLTSDRCPEPDDNVEAKAISHWNTTPDPSSHSPDLPTWRAGDLWKYDPDIEREVIDQQWMNDCLFASTYPPPDVSRSNSVPDK
jgi:uncharacterized protein YecT (DUF1311 family)